MRSKLEVGVEWALFASRWILAPFYLGMVVALGAVDFSGMKLKLIASIVAISAIALLRAFLPLSDEGVRVDAARLSWMVAIHLTFVVSRVLLAAMDWISSKVHVQAASG